MRKHYLDNIRWITVVIVVFYHVIYMYNAEGIVGVLGRVTDLKVQYYDVFQYIVYPWFMTLLFMVSGVSSRLYLDRHTEKEFVKSRTRKLLVPCTVGILVFQFLQGYLNTVLSGVLEREEIPLIGKVFAILFSGIGVLWYIQMLWIFSMALLLVRKIDKDRLWEFGGRAGLFAMIGLAVPTFLAAQILNTPIICVYRFGLYFFSFLLGYFVLSHDEVIEVLKKWFPLFCGVAVVLGTAFCIKYFGGNYADKPINRTILFVGYAYFACMAIFGGMAKYADLCTPFTRWMSWKSFGLYVFHYLGISAVAVFLGKSGLVHGAGLYILSTLAGYVGAYLLYEIISRIPFYRWAVLGIKKES